MRLRVLAVLTVVAAGCSRNLEIPELPGAGSIQGTIVFTTEGRTMPRPAAGATVELTRDGRVTEANADGFFRIDNIITDEGSIVFRFENPTDKQQYEKRLTLREIKAGVSRDIDLGTVTLGQTATVLGKVTLSDLPGPGGMGGTLVFVPEGPQLTQTSDDGSFVMTGIPEGGFTLSFFRSGYFPQTIDGTVRAAEEFRVRAIVLQRDPGVVVPSRFTGRVQIIGQSSFSGVIVTAQGGAGQFSATTDEDGSFLVADVPAGLYNVGFQKDGFLTVTLRNVLAAAGGTDLGPVIMSPGQSTMPNLDAGLPPMPDAGMVDAGQPDASVVVDSGTPDASVTVDAGPVDSGAVDAGPIDSGTPDAGGVVDAGVPDAGQPDAGQPDAGQPDAGQPDAGQADAGAPDAGPGVPTWFNDAGSFAIISGASQTVLSQSQLAAPVRVEIRDNNGNPIANQPLVMVSGSPGAVILPPQVTTNLQGQAVMDIVAPRNLGAAQVILQNPDGGGPAAFVNLTVLAPDAGLVSTVLNRDRISGSGTGIGTMVRSVSPYGLAVASDGTIYFTDGNHQIRRVSTTGVVDIVAGTTQGLTVPGPAATSKFNNPTGLALDEARQLLYVSDKINKLIRVVDLAARTVDVVAGGGSSTAPGYGDGTFGNAVFPSPEHLTFREEASGPVLYIGDEVAGRIRRLDLTTRGITAFIDKTTGQGVDFSDCGDNFGCDIVFGSNGNAFFSGRFTVNASFVSGVGRRAPDGKISLVTGVTSAPGNTADGVSSLAVYFPTVPLIGIDARGDLFVSDRSKHIVRRIESGTGRIVTVAGRGSFGNLADDYQPGPTVALNIPGKLASDAAGNMYFNDQANHCIRVIWNIRRTSAPKAILSASSPVSQTSTVFQVPPQPLAVLLTDANNAVMQSYSVSWSALTEGAWISPSSTLSNASGIASSVSRGGLTVASLHQYRASFVDVFGNEATGSPVVFDVTTSAPAAGTVFTVVNATHVSSSGGTPGAAHQAGISTPAAITAAADGRIFFSSGVSNLIYMLRPSGLLEVIAGTGTSGSGGDNGPATLAQVGNVEGLAYDNVGQLLYFSDSSYHVIRRINLGVNPPTMETFAGVRNASAPLNDGQPTALAGLNTPTHLGLRTEASVQYLYVADRGHHRIVKMTTSGSMSTTFLSGTVGPVLGTSPLTVGGNGLCQTGEGCSFAWDSAGTFYLGGGFSNGSTTSTSIVAYNQAANTYTRIAGIFQGSQNDGVAATTASFNEVPSFFFDASDNMYVLAHSHHKIRFIDKATGIITTYAGDGTAAFAGELAPVSTIKINRPSNAVLLNGHIFFNDSQNHTMRVIW